MLLSQVQLANILKLNESVGHFLSQFPLGAKLPSISVNLPTHSIFVFPWIEVFPRHLNLSIMMVNGNGWVYMKCFIWTDHFPSTMNSRFSHFICHVDALRPRRQIYIKLNMRQFCDMSNK
jgi:hypothetical protein